jgi:hypothetical protein
MPQQDHAGFVTQTPTVLLRRSLPASSFGRAANFTLPPNGWMPTARTPQRDQAASVTHFQAVLLRRFSP